MLKLTIQVLAHFTIQVLAQFTNQFYRIRPVIDVVCPRTDNGFQQDFVYYVALLYVGVRWKGWAPRAMLVSMKCGGCGHRFA